MMRKFTFSILLSIVVLCSCGTNKRNEILSEADLCDLELSNIGEGLDSKSPVKLIGLFENLRSTPDHCYGNALTLWKIDNQVMGFFNLYEGNIEPSRTGPIVFGTLINDTLNFSASTKQSRGFSDWKTSDKIIYSFKGVINKDTLSGRLSVFNCTTSQPVGESDKNIKLHSSDLWDFDSYKNLNEWREHFSSKLKEE